MKTLKNVFLFLGMLLLGAAVTAAQDAPVLTPFTDEVFGVQGLTPEGWTRIQAGVYARGSGARDVVLLAVQSAPLSSDALMTALLPQFGLSAAPESTGRLESPALEWHLYQFSVTQAGITLEVDLALAEQTGTTYIVLVQSGEGERETLAESVFFPVVESIQPLIEDTSALPYGVEEVAFESGTITLAGTLTLPPGGGPHPAVVLLTGSGPQDRDEQVAGFRVFRVIADALTRRGIAVLRFDDRGVGASTGDWASADLSAFADDARAAIHYLGLREDIDAEQIGVLGHSIGGALTAILGADPASGAAFLISMAGPGVDGRETLLEQNRVLLTQQGASSAQIDSQIAFLQAALPQIEARDWDAYKQLLHDTLVEQWDLLSEEQRAASGVSSAEEFAEAVGANGLASVSNEEFISLLSYDPAPDWEKTRVPVLALYGEFDLQVPPSPHAPALEAAFAAGGNADATVVIIAGANHLFQHTATGAIEEYSQLPPEFTADFLPTIADWILERVMVATP
ncbi:MAG: alpha/beta hydrolase [Anaerolineae bacterium]|nr:alpha/beta hydrolase [Anaerolineae bacterium]NUQ04103.1 alpha/beta hydrolase [Anaerolineae bacterium]